MKERLQNLLRLDLKTEALSGLTVALALVPEAVAFAIVAGVDPLVGLYAAFMVGLITSLFGGRPGMISGATGALAIVMAELVQSHGVQYLFAAVVLMGLIQILIGLLKLGKLIRIIPHPVMIGFVNGLAIVIFLAQIKQLRPNGVWMQGAELFTMLALIAITLAIIYVLPRLTKAVPSALTAIVVLSVAVIFFNIDTTTVGDLGAIKGGLPVFNVPMVPFNLDTLYVILPYAFIFAAIGLMESLMTLSLVDEITGTRGSGNRECIGQGLANVLTGFFGGMGGCAMIGQSMINVKAGGRSRVSSFIAAIALLMFILFASGLIEQIPMAVLMGVMFSVVIGTFEWTTFKLARNIRKSELLVIAVVMALTVAYDLAIAVLVGVIISALNFAWEKGKSIELERVEEKDDLKIYHVKGTLFFGSVYHFLEAFQMQEDCEVIIIDFEHARVFDHSGIEALNTITERYRAAGKTVYLRHLSNKCLRLLDESKEVVKVNVIDGTHPEPVTVD